MVDGHWPSVEAANVGALLYPSLRIRPIDERGSRISTARKKYFQPVRMAFSEDLSGARFVPRLIMASLDVSARAPMTFSLKFFSPSEGVFAQFPFVWLRGD